jgi:hypothetical protein
VRGKRIRGLRLAVALVAGAAAAGCLASPDSDDGAGDAAQLLVNPDFEDGLSGWEFAGAVEVAPADELGFPPPATGVRVALLSTRPPPAAPGRCSAPPPRPMRGRRSA